MVGARVGKSGLGSCWKVSVAVPGCCSRPWLMDTQSMGAQTTQRTTNIPPERLFHACHRSVWLAPLLQLRQRYLASDADKDRRHFWTTSKAGASDFPDEDFATKSIEKDEYPRSRDGSSGTLNLCSLHSTGSVELLSILRCIAVGCACHTAIIHTAVPLLTHPPLLDLQRPLNHNMGIFKCDLQCLSYTGANEARAAPDQRIERSQRKLVEWAQGKTRDHQGEQHSLFRIRKALIPTRPLRFVSLRSSASASQHGAKPFSQI